MFERVLATRRRSHAAASSFSLPVILAAAALTLASCTEQQDAARTPASQSEPARDTGDAGTSPPVVTPSPRTPEYVTEADDLTDAEGRFELRELATGSYRVTFGEPGDPAYTRLDGVRVNDIYGVNLFNLRLGPSGESAPLAADEYQPNRLPHLIRGSVVGAGGSPVAGVRVRARRQ